MKVLVLLMCLVSVVICQTKNNNGNPTGEIGAPAFDEIVVHSTLNVRGKSASRGAKALVNENNPKTATESKPKTVALLNTGTTQTAAASDGAVLTLKRTKRVPRRYNNGGYGGFGGLPSASSSSAQASSNSFNQNTPFGSFGASASQTASQSQNFGPHGLQASAGQSASQTYRLPNGNQIDVSFSSGYSTGDKGGPSFSGGHAITVTRPDGHKYQVAGRR